MLISIGALLLLRSGTNQSYKDASYEIKLQHYIKTNNFAKSLNDLFYKNNPNAKEFIDKFGFNPHPHFKKEDIKDREELVKRICEDIWNTEYFDK